MMSNAHPEQPHQCSKVPEFCGRLEEENVSNKAFELIFAFDEVIAVGYKEKVTLQQIKTFLEMDSQEEKIHEMLKKVRPLVLYPLDAFITRDRLVDART